MRTIKQWSFWRGIYLTAISTKVQGEAREMMRASAHDYAVRGRRWAVRYSDSSKERRRGGAVTEQAVLSLMKLADRPEQEPPHAA